MALVAIIGIGAILALTGAHNVSLENKYRYCEEKKKNSCGFSGSFPFPRDRSGKEDLWIPTKDFIRPGNIDLPSGCRPGDSYLENVEGSWASNTTLGIPCTVFVKNGGYSQIVRPEVLYL